MERLRIHWANHGNYQTLQTIWLGRMNLFCAWLYLLAELYVLLNYCGQESMQENMHRYLTLYIEVFLYIVTSKGLSHSVPFHYILDCFHRIPSLRSSGLPWNSSAGLWLGVRVFFSNILPSIRTLLLCMATFCSLLLYINTRT